jgi:hypothetical protein
VFNVYLRSCCLFLQIVTFRVKQALHGTKAEENKKKQNVGIFFWGEGPSLLLRSACALQKNRLECSITAELTRSSAPRAAL